MFLGFGLVAAGIVVLIGLHDKTDRAGKLIIRCAQLLKSSEGLRLVLRTELRRDDVIPMSDGSEPEFLLSASPYLITYFREECEGDEEELACLQKRRARWALEIAWNNGQVTALRVVSPKTKPLDISNINHREKCAAAEIRRAIHGELTKL